MSANNASSSSSSNSPPTLASLGLGNGTSVLSVSNIAGSLSALQQHDSLSINNIFPAGVPPIPPGMQSMMPINGLQSIVSAPAPQRDNNAGLTGGIQGIPGPILDQNKSNLLTALCNITSETNKTSLNTVPTPPIPKPANKTITAQKSANSSGGISNRSNPKNESNHADNENKKMDFSPVFLLQRMRIPLQGNVPLQLPTINKMSGVQYTWAASSGLPAPFLVIPNKSEQENGARPKSATAAVARPEAKANTSTSRKSNTANSSGASSGSINAASVRSDTQNLRPFACAQCGKRFNHKYNLKRHYLIHTGEKPYACEHCQKRFNQKSNLIQHIRTHTGEKPYKCDKCEKRFAQRSTFSQHQRIHSRGAKRKSS